jgi:hypothetical protein
MKMIRRLTGAVVLGVAAATLITGAATGGHQALTSMTPALVSFNYAAPPAPPAKKCAANSTSGVIGGQSKCLAAGQQCQQQNANDYTRYGFNCAKAGNRFQLSRRGGAKPALAKPAPAKPAPAKPGH